jgi:hypothetical protein
VYWKATAAPPRALPVPLWIVVAIAAPDDGAGPLLDYERELLSGNAAVRASRSTGVGLRLGVLCGWATPLRFVEIRRLVEIRPNRGQRVASTQSSAQ